MREKRGMHGNGAKRRLFFFHFFSTFFPFFFRTRRIHVGNWAGWSSRMFAGKAALALFAGRSLQRKDNNTSIRLGILGGRNECTEVAPVFVQ